ncbi:hypothetical protein KQI42_12470 [Tissierella sp. MSJ-40]|uniref:ABC-2 family transporter protein n=1 Tax=Tissierella simiarum TaxID=2841534 RepID=A0ABS6E9E7_9FIRM|nr:hypothetical protein [Tissierella simiarum]MBU5438834.1 hypothetical protein [Tissierella simiarum]
MDAVKRLMKYQNYDFKKDFLSFWAVIICVNIGGYILNSSFGRRYVDMRIGMMSKGSNGVSVAGANLIPILIFIIAYCIEMYQESFPLAIGFSSTRRNFYKSVIFSNVIFSMAMAVIEAVLLKADRLIITSIGREPLLDFNYFHIVNDNILFIILSLFLAFLTCCGVFNLLGTLVYKFGYKFWIAFGILATIILNIAGLKNIIWEGGKTLLLSNNFPSYAMKALIISLMTYVLGWLIIRKVDMKSSKN